MFLCSGKFCGSFKDQHESPPASDDEGDSEEGLYQPKDHDKLKRLKKLEDGKKKAVKARKSKMATFMSIISSGDQVGSRLWTRYLQTEEVEDYKGAGYSLKMEAPVIRVSNIKLTPNMVKSLRNYPQVHTIELTNCNLKAFPFKIHEMTSLRCLQLCRNSLPQFTHDLTQGEGKHSRLQRLVLSEDYMRYIAPDSLAGDSMQDLVFLDLTKNKLDMLPTDFCLGAKNLEFLRLQANQLSVIPSSTFKCKNLLLIDITGNKLKSLPEDVDVLPKLRKLYASSNQLTHLPHWIGECKTLEKIRVSSNKLRELPANFLKLEHWQDNPANDGLLEELMVDGNPLVVPSITAFEMGGLKQMFRLFREYVRKEEERKREALFQEGALAVIPEEGLVRNHHLSETRQKAQQSPPALLLDASGSQELRQSANVLTQAAIMDVGSEGDVGGIPSTQPADLDRMADPTKKDGTNFFFVDLEPSKINEIRSMESAVLLVKKALHVENQKSGVRKMQQDALENDGPEVPGWMTQMLEPTFTLNDYKRRVPASEVDLYFVLTVYSCQPPLFNSCRQIFERFATEHPKMGKFLLRKDFDNFLSHLPVKLPEEMRTHMWKLLTYQSAGGFEEERVEMEQFIAGFHVHDIDNPDPFIERVAKVLRLQYYQGGMKALRARLAAKNIEGEATVLIESDSSDEFEEEENAQLPQSLPMMEGEHRPPHLKIGSMSSAIVAKKQRRAKEKTCDINDRISVLGLLQFEKG